MKLNLQIEDRLFEVYESRFGTPKLYAKIKQAIEAFANVPDNDRVLMLYGPERKAIEAIFQTTLDTPEKLVKLVESMASIKLHDVELRFTDDELKRLKMQSTFHGRTMEQFVLEMMHELKSKMLEQV